MFTLTTLAFLVYIYTLPPNHVTFGRSIILNTRVAMWSCTFNVRKHLVRRAFKTSYTSLEDGVTGPINYIYELYIHIQFILLCIKGGGGYTPLPRIVYSTCVYWSVYVYIYVLYDRKKTFKFY